MNKNRIEGAADQGERARSREALVIKGKRRRSGGRAAKECVLTWGDLALRLKGRRCWSEKSAEAVVVSGNKILAKGRRNRRRRPVIIGNGLSQMFAIAKLADMVNRVKPEGPRQRETRPAGLQISGFRMC
jgi:RNA-directed DNA polymerase